MKYCNIVSVSWGDHLVFGEGDGRLDNPGALQRRMEHWRKDLKVASIHWRHLCTRIKGNFYAARGYKHPYCKPNFSIDWDDFEIVPRLAHEIGLNVYLYVSLFNEGRPLAPKKIREVSYHNKMHGQHVSWQSTFSRQHPEYAVVGRTGRCRQWGVLCLAYPEVRAYFIKRYLGLLEGYKFDGLFVCMRSQSRPADFADQFGFNEPVRQDFKTQYGRDIYVEDFDLKSWRGLLGNYLTMFLTELRGALNQLKIRLAVGVPRSDILGPPLGNSTLYWREWVKKRLINELIINQNSSQCPSMWHQLWPMHRGYGYLQNYLDEYNMSPLIDHLNLTYLPEFIDQPVDLYVASQWDERSVEKETELLTQPFVKGLVFSSFRHDNPGPIAKGDWRA